MAVNYDAEFYSKPVVSKIKDPKSGRVREEIKTTIFFRFKAPSCADKNAAPYEYDNVATLRNIKEYKAEYKLFLDKLFAK